VSLIDVSNRQGGSHCKGMRGNGALYTVLAPRSWQRTAASANTRSNPSRDDGLAKGDVSITNAGQIARSLAPKMLTL
jgi:hypothetical protein